MKAISDEALRQQFMGWQMRIRQIAMREHGGRPLAAMRPLRLDIQRRGGGWRR